MALQRRALFIFLCAMKLVTVAYIAVLNRSYLDEKFDNRTSDADVISTAYSTSEIDETCECGMTGNERVRNSTELFKVISYSLYGDTDNQNIKNRYFKQVASRAGEVRELYKGWQMRVYHNLTSQHSSYRQLCQVQCKLPGIIKLVDMNEPANERHNKINPRLWRFLPLLDTDVEILATRDLDSRISSRETSAVAQWLNSSLSFHVMRDHPLHGAFILAGTWGAKVSQHPTLSKNIGNLMLTLGTAQDEPADQRFLGLYVWPITQYDTMVHDSYYCNRWDFTFFGWLKSFPFPTRRNGFDFVGNIDVGEEQQKNTTNGLLRCPISCRPVYGKSWRYC